MTAWALLEQHPFDALATCCNAIGLPLVFSYLFWGRVDVESRGGLSPLGTRDRSTHIAMPMLAHPPAPRARAPAPPWRPGSLFGCMLDHVVARSRCRHEGRWRSPGKKLPHARESATSLLCMSTSELSRVQSSTTSTWERLARLQASGGMPVLLQVEGATVRWPSSQTPIATFIILCGQRQGHCPILSILAAGGESWPREGHWVLRRTGGMCRSGVKSGSEMHVWPIRCSDQGYRCRREVVALKGRHYEHR